MHARCKDATAKNYGAKGIRVCEAWRSFDVFSAWAFSSGYTAGLTIERMNSMGDYSPENCKWADRKEQSRNRSIVRFAPDGRLWIDVAAEHGIPSRVLNCRVSAGGWPIEVAATWPVGKRRTNRKRDDTGKFAKVDEKAWRR